jgi:hypothetical protein
MMIRSLTHLTTRGLLPLLLGVVTASVADVGHVAMANAQTAGRGTITGHVRLLGKLPGNPVIRMRRDPLCAKINQGKQVVQETVVAALDGSLANVFVRLQGTFPDAPVPTQPVTIDQHGCIYTPRVVGLRVGQTLQVRNSDDLLHNVHSLSARSNSFNVGQPMAGMVYQFRPKDEETMLRVSCDLHSWMTAYVGIVNHPYFDVTGNTGTFEIKNVPAGRYTIQAWHEQYGDLKQTVAVTSGTAAMVDFSFSGTAQASPVETNGVPPRRGAVP